VVRGGRGRWPSAGWSAVVVGLLLAVVCSAVVLAVAGSGAVAGGAPPLDEGRQLQEAVRRTLAAGTARLTATVRTGSGPAVEVTGVTSLVGPEASVTATMPGAGRVDVRVTGSGAWLRAGGDGAPWARVDPAAVRLAAGTRGWADLLAGLRPTDLAGTTAGVLHATSDGRPATVELDDAGRIRRLVVDHGSASLALRLADHGLPLHVEPP
jgi:hypothetical protein